MAPAFTPLLAEGRQAHLDLGPGGFGACRITGFAGPEVYLQVDDRLFEGGDPASGYLLFDDGDVHMQAVRGQVRRVGPGSAVLELTDRFPGQRRLFSRAPLVLPARVSEPGGEEWDTVTRDVSAGGLLLARRPAWSGGERCEVTLTLADGVRISADAELRRASGDSLGVRFVRIEPDHRAVLAELALAYHAS